VIGGEAVMSLRAICLVARREVVYAYSVLRIGARVRMRDALGAVLSR
jgi:hypothetical protein